jgi:hypothetical protein
MTEVNSPQEILKIEVFTLVANCRERLKSGMVDVSEIEGAVRGFCESVVALPSDQAGQYKQDLNDLMVEITKLGEELTIARDVVRKELGSLEKLRKANVAYQNSDGVGEKFVKKEE